MIMGALRSETHLTGLLSQDLYENDCFQNGLYLIRGRFLILTLYIQDSDKQRRRDLILSLSLTSFVMLQVLRFILFITLFIFIFKYLSIIFEASESLAMKKVWFISIILFSYLRDRTFPRYRGWTFVLVLASRWHASHITIWILTTCMIWTWHGFIPLIYLLITLLLKLHDSTYLKSITLFVNIFWTLHSRMFLSEFRFIVYYDL